MAARGCHGFCQAEEILGIAGPEVGIEKKTRNLDNSFSCFQEKERVASTSGEIFSLCPRNHVNASSLYDNQNIGGLCEVHADLYGK